MSEANGMTDARAPIVVTGAAGGIGHAVAKKLVARGERVVAVDLNGEKLATVFGETKEAETIACDLASDAGFEELVSRLGAIKGFVHAAGFDAMAPLGMIGTDVMQRLFVIHAVFPVRFLGWMAKKANHAPDAAAVLITSLSTHEGAKGHVAYAAAKGAVEGMLKPAAAELLEKGIRLNAVALGVVDTEMSRGWMGKLPADRIEALKREYPLGLGDPERVADIVCFLLSPGSGWIAGQTIVANGGKM